MTTVTTARERIDSHPTHSYGPFKLRAGRPLPFGATLVPSGVNFAIYSRHATECTLVLFQRGDPQPMIEIPFPHEFRIGDVFTMIVFDLDIETIEYGFRLEGPYDPSSGHRFDASKILLDPYAKGVSGRDTWGQPPDWDNAFQHRSFLIYDDFDWESDTPLRIPMEDLIIYEMHVRGFTRHPSSGSRHPGTFAALREKIPYLRQLGVNCVELLPIFEFDEHENSRPNPATGETLLNYWGYSTVGFFAPKAGYAATARLGMQADELKTLVKELHRNGIEVILDVVFNHTAEGNEHGPMISFRGIDNQTYYMLTPEGYYYNFSGTGNTLNCNNPIVRDLVCDCLRYWVSEYHIDGFRFDLAAILGRAPSGAPLSNPPLLESLAYDPVLGTCKLIAEAWDAGGLYQVGTFPSYGRWAEWNGKYRDAMRRFLKGDAGLVGEVSQRVQGSPDIYAWRGPTASVNFFTCHDGFTLADLVSYNQKHNDANGEGNRDGGDDNNSWNCGWEGPTDDPGVLALRRRQIKNALALLLVSQGVPMIQMGDELGRTQQGNNNTYCHDSELNWLDWSMVESNAELLRFARACIHFRRAHPALRSHQHFRNTDYMGSGFADITWHGTQAWNADWSDGSRVLAFMLCGKHAKGGTASDSNIYVAINMYWDALSFEIPTLPAGRMWSVFANTGAESPGDCSMPGDEPLLPDQRSILVGGRSIVILIGQ
ncbi:glycogen debranching protein GlgX [Chloroflexia bacterium SDU3-3]|nr:glycogen debranching protein GlgX [Chloroflexia bacterium SDU3-3]